MENQIIGLLPCQNRYQFTEIFGYTSKSLPGLEIVGLGIEGRHIKEKFIYLTKVLGLKIPKLRFVLCVETLDLSKEELKDKQWLELPLLVLYFQLAEILPIEKLCHCVASGKVLSSLKITEPMFEFKKLEELFSKHNELKLLSNFDYDAQQVISLSELMAARGFELI